MARLNNPVPVFLFILFICLTPVFAKSKNISELDSLHLKLKSNLVDTIRFEVFKKIAELYSKQPNDTSVYYLKNAAELALKINDKLRAGEAYHLISKYYTANKKFTEAFNWVNKLEQLQQKYSDTTLLFKVITAKIELYRQLNQLNKVAEFHGEKIKIFHAQKDTLQEIKTYYLKGWTEFNAGLFREGITDLNTGKNLTEKTKKKKNLREMLLWTGACYNGLKKYDSALYFQNKVLEFNLAVRDTYQLGEIHRYMGDVYIKMLNFNTALEFYNKSLNYFSLAKAPLRYNLLITYRARALDSLKRYKEAAADLNSLFKSNRLKEDGNTWMWANMIGKDVYAKSGDLAKSISCYKEYEILNKELQLDGAHQDILIAEFKKEQEKDKALQAAEQKEKDAALEYENQKQKTIRNSLIGSVIFIGIFAVSIFISLRKSKKARKIISNQKEQLQEKQKEILDSIHYAKRIQNALLPSEKYITRNLNELNKNEKK